MSTYVTLLVIKKKTWEGFFILKYAQKLKKEKKKNYNQNCRRELLKRFVVAFFIMAKHF